MARPAMKTRGVKVSDDVWNAALTAADERQEVLSEEIRKFLERYAKGKR